MVFVTEAESGARIRRAATKSAIGATDFCVVHGGGKRCAQKEGCTKSAEGATNFCIVHGGGLRCPNCATWPDSRSGNRKYDGNCATCFNRIFPTDPRSMVIYEHTKEILVRNALNEIYSGRFLHNNPIYTGQCCTHLRRTDHRMQINDTLLCVETSAGKTRSSWRSLSCSTETRPYGDVCVSVALTANSRGLPNREARQG